MQRLALGILEMSFRVIKLIQFRKILGDKCIFKDAVLFRKFKGLKISFDSTWIYVADFSKLMNIFLNEIDRVMQEWTEIYFMKQEFFGCKCHLWSKE